MDAKLFLAYLPWLRAPEYKIFQLGLINTNYSKQLEKDTTPLKRAEPIHLEDAPSNIQSLFSEYSLQNLRFLNGTNFWPEPQRLEQGWGFADMSEVNLVVAADGKVEAYWAHPIKDIPGSTDCICALANSLEGYLEALFCAQFNTDTFIRGFPDEDPIRFKKTILVAKQCALIAGGYEYYDFWAGLLGLPHTDTIPES